VTARVLVADDSAVIRMLVEGILRELDLEVVQAVDGRDALAKLDGVQLVITDLSMPGVGGHELVAAAKVPVIVMTTPSRAGEVAADACVTKPIDRATLVAAVRRLIG
jgi:two-component system chemotaxis response regulator CheY